MEAKQVPLIERFASVPADARPEQESFSNEAISATQAAWKMGYDAAKAEQPEQKPVPWESFFKRYCPWLEQPEQESFSPEAIRATQAAWKMGYDAAKAEQPEQEPVQFKCTVIDDAHPNGIPLEQWAKPPQREWVDLTPKEIEACRQKGYVNGGLNAPFDFDKAAGALLANAKEKNT